MAEVLANSFIDPTTILNGGIDSSVTSVAVVDAAEIPTIGSTRILVWDGTDDSSKELMKVTAVVANTLTVVRGIEGPGAQAHVSGENVELVQSKGSLEDFFAQGTALVNYLIAR